MIRGLFARLRGRRAQDTEARRQLDAALEEARRIAEQMQSDGAALTARVKRNAASGRKLIGGDKPL